MLEERDVSLYMERVKAKIEEELVRARRFLHGSSLAKVSQRCETHMVAEHLNFLYSECVTMVQCEKRNDLSNMYDLLKSVQNAMLVLVDTVLDHIKTQGLTVSLQFLQKEDESDKCKSYHKRKSLKLGTFTANLY